MCLWCDVFMHFELPCCWNDLCKFRGLIWCDFLICVDNLGCRKHFAWIPLIFTNIFTEKNVQYPVQVSGSNCLYCHSQKHTHSFFPLLSTKQRSKNKEEEGEARQEVSNRTLPSLNSSHFAKSVSFTFSDWSKRSVGAFIVIIRDLLPVSLPRCKVLITETYRHLWDPEITRQSRSMLPLLIRKFGFP